LWSNWLSFPYWAHCMLKNQFRVMIPTAQCVQKTHRYLQTWFRRRHRSSLFASRHRRRRRCPPRSRRCPRSPRYCSLHYHCNCSSDRNLVPYCHYVGKGQDANLTRPCCGLAVAGQKAVGASWSRDTYARRHRRCLGRLCHRCEDWPCLGEIQFPKDGIRQNSPKRCWTWGCGARVCCPRASTYDRILIFDWQVVL
jgi:hypothetical protein